MANYLTHVNHTKAILNINSMTIKERIQLIMARHNQRLDTAQFDFEANEVIEARNEEILFALVDSVERTERDIDELKAKLTAHTTSKF